MWFRHLLCFYFGQEHTSALERYLPAVMEGLFSFTSGRALDLPEGKILTLTLTNHLLGDLVLLSANRRLGSFTGPHRCNRCRAGPATCCKDGEEGICLLCLADFLYPFDPLNQHQDFALHFLLNWGIRVIRVVDGYAVSHGCEEQLYEAFANPKLHGVGLKKEQGTESQKPRLIGKHIDELRDVLPYLAGLIGDGDSSERLGMVFVLWYLSSGGFSCAILRLRRYVPWPHPWHIL